MADAAERVVVDVASFKAALPAEFAKQLDRPMTDAELAAFERAAETAIRANASADPTSGLAKFLSFLSHDLRGGLNGAVLMIEVLKRELGGESKLASAVDDLDVVRRSILDTVATMERFVHAERLRLGRIPVTLAPVNLSKLAGELQKSFAYQLQDRGIKLHLAVASDVEILSDQRLLTMVLGNLVSNAIKYCGRQDITLSVQTGGDLPEGVKCRLSVADRGAGISDEQREKYLRKFDKGDSYGDKGSGLGLFIAGQAATLLNARLWAESQPKAGSTFHLDLTQA